MAYSVTTSHRAGNMMVSWRYRLYHGDESAYTTFAEFDSTTAAGEQWWGMVVGEPSVRRSIDLAKCTAKVSNLSLTLADADFRGAPLWDELNPFTASRKYINRKVEVLQMVNGLTSTTTIYTGRLRAVTRDRGAGTVQLEIEPNQPWDFISVPQEQSTTGRYFPVVFGAFVNRTSTPAAPGGISDAADLWPCPVDRTSASLIYALLHEDADSDTHRLHYYERGLDLFLPLVDASDNYSSKGIGFDNDWTNYVGYVQNTLRRAIAIKPVAIDPAETNDFTDAEKAYDVPLAADTGTFGYHECSIATDADTDQGEVSFEFPKMDTGIPSGSYDVLVRYSLAYANTNFDDHQYQIRFNGDLITHSVTTSLQTETYTVTADRLESPFTILHSLVGLLSQPTPATVTLRIYDVIAFPTAEVDAASGDVTALEQALKGIDVLYSGGDGLDMSWGGGTVAAKAHEAHRELLTRFAGLSTSTPAGYSDLDTARSSWSVRFALLDAVELREVLEQLQYEGQFIFDWAPDGTARYLFVKASYSSGDVAATLNEDDDTTGIEYSHTPLTELVTQQEIKYQRHPADDRRYLASESFTNSTARTAWNIQTLENVETVKLDYLVAAADEFAAIRDAVLGDVHPVIQTTIITPKYMVLTVGDVIQVEDDDNYYMITEERRSPGGLAITARRVG